MHIVFMYVQCIYLKVHYDSSLQVEICKEVVWEEEDDLWPRPFLYWSSQSVLELALVVVG